MFKVVFIHVIMASLVGTVSPSALRCAFPVHPCVECRLLVGGNGRARVSHRDATWSKRRAWVANGQRQQRHRLLKQLRTAVPNLYFSLSPPLPRCAVQFPVRTQWRKDGEGAGRQAGRQVLISRCVSPPCLPRASEFWESRCPLIKEPAWYLTRWSSSARLLSSETRKSGKWPFRFMLNHGRGSQSRGRRERKRTGK